MSASDLTDTAQNYLKTVWAVGEWSEEDATISKVAERMSLSAATVSVGIKKLSEQGLVEHQPYGGIELTALGRRYALEIVRRHRLIETFLVQVLHYRWDQVHEDAEHMEHAVSDLMIERLDELLGHPRRDPHGDPIPSADGHVEWPRTVRLADAEPDTQVRIEQISDSDAELLQQLAHQGIGVGSAGQVLTRDRYGTSTTVVFADHGQVEFSPASAGRVRVSVLDKHDAFK